jgi:hypothetical protein
MKQDEFKRYHEQVIGIAKPEYPRGKLDKSDEGALAIAVGVDKENRTIILSFGKPVKWIGMGPDEVNGLITILKNGLLELGESVKITI